MDALAGQSGSRQDLFAECRERDECVDFSVVRSKPAMNDIHARYRCRPRQRRTETSMPQAGPWKMADAFLARLVFPKKQSICARQPVVVQGLNDRHGCSVRSPENTRTQKWERVVHMYDIRRKARNRFFHHGIAAERPNGSKSRRKKPEGAGAVQFLSPGKSLLHFVAVLPQEIRFESHDRLFSAPARTIFVVNLKDAQAFRRLHPAGRLTGERPRPSPLDFREACKKKCLLGSRGIAHRSPGLPRE